MERVWWSNLEEIHYVYQIFEEGMIDPMHPWSVEKETNLYDKFLSSLMETSKSNSEEVIWLSRSILSLLKEDEQNTKTKDKTWNKILANCFVLILALVGPDEADQHGERAYSELDDEEKEQCLKDIARII